jgi:outer membrane biosynthesis protein TonB
MRSLRIAAALTLAFGALFATPANAFTAQTFQFTFFWTAREFTFTDKTVTVTVINNITNKIGGNGEVIDTYRITLGDQRIDVTEKHDARDYVFVIEGTQTIRLEGIDRGFWAGDWGPIMAISANESQPVIEPPSESPVIEPSPEPTPDPTPEPTPEPQPEPITESPTISAPIEPTPEPTESPVTESPVIESPVIVPTPEPVPAAPSQAETEERASDVLGDYERFWTDNGISEADYSHNLAIVRWYQIKANYDQAIAESKRGKAFIFAMQLEGQLRTIQSLYANGSLKPKVTQEPTTPEPTPEQQTSSPEPTTPEPSPTPPVETTPEETSQPTPTPSVPEPLPSSEPQPTLQPQPRPTKPEQTPRPSEPVAVSQEPVSQSESSEVTSESPSISEEVIEVAETPQPEQVSATITPAGIEETLGAVITLFATAGLDMTSEQREKAQGVIVPSVIAAQVATLAMRRIK